jgi:hypothetical protein
MSTREVQAKDLRAGMRIQTANGSLVSVTDVAVGPLGCGVWVNSEAENLYVGEASAPVTILNEEHLPSAT